MKIKIFWEWEISENLLEKVKNVAWELWLLEFIEIEKTNSEELRIELWIEKEPALIIEEEEIDFKDVIFEWIVPEEEEIKSMFISIIGGSEGWCWDCSTWWCGDWGCSTC